MKNKNKNDKLDISIHNKVEDILIDKLTNELINALSLQKTLELLMPICKEEAIRITKDAVGDVKDRLDKERESILAEITG